MKVIGLLVLLIGEMVNPISCFSTCSNESPSKLLVIIERIPQKDTGLVLNSNEFESLIQEVGGSLLGIQGTKLAIILADIEQSAIVSRTLLNSTAYLSGKLTFQINAIEIGNGAMCNYTKDCTSKSYNLVLFLANLNKETVRIASQMEFQHKEYLKNMYNDHLITIYGDFKERIGGFAVFSSSVNNKQVYGDPAVFNLYLETESINFYGCDQKTCNN